MKPTQYSLQAVPREDKMEKLWILMSLLTVCCALTKDMSGKVFVFPGSADPYEVKLKTSKNSFGSLTSCLRYKTDDTFQHTLLSLSTTSHTIGFHILVSDTNKITLTAADTDTDFSSLDLAGNTWHRICATWCSDTGLGQLWLDGKHTVKKSTSSGSVVSGSPEFTLGKGLLGIVDYETVFIGMISDVHTWDYVLSPTELQHYMDNTEFLTGNVHNWRALDFSITGKVLEEEDLML
ncbi:C-reactive protein-like [Synchiropus splendidus]|uniref:C-reactive protein-like n=1 Tax=Synchiropus splendidus TaxID=270530 RepID=UPI00237DB73F|nr:C-reactive protein-like [Synchiropus splendidus]